jgi:hypothetical protein
MALSPHSKFQCFYPFCSEQILISLLGYPLTTDEVDDDDDDDDEVLHERRLDEFMTSQFLNHITIFVV